MCCDVSDHFPVFHIDYSDCVVLPRKTFTKRVYNHENIVKFVSMLSNKSWSDVLLCNDTQMSYSKFHEELREVYDACFPLNTFKQGYNTRKPWLTEAMKEQIKIKNRLYKMWKKSGKSDLESIYKRFRNKLNRFLKAAEKEHYAKLFEETFRRKFQKSQEMMENS